MANGNVTSSLLREIYPFASRLQPGAGQQMYVSWGREIRRKMEPNTQKRQRLTRKWVWSNVLVLSKHEVLGSKQSRQTRFRNYCEWKVKRSQDFFQAYIALDKVGSIARLQSTPDGKKGDVDLSPRPEGSEFGFAGKIQRHIQIKEKGTGYRKYYYSHTTAQWLVQWGLTRDHIWIFKLVSPVCQLYGRSQDSSLFNSWPYF